MAPVTNNAAVLPHDLTMVVAGPVSGGDVVVDAGTVATGGDNERGVDTSATRTTTITADGITTSGASADGIHAVGYGDISIKAGTTATTGYRSDGIYANSNLAGATGGIAISADQVSTEGAASTGMTASAYHGAVAITAGTVKTGGYGSDGITEWSYDNDASVKVGTVATTGDAGRGIVAYSGGTTTVVASDVSTSGQGLGSFADAGAIKAVGAAVNVQAGTVSTKGGYSAGIYASSNLVHDNGQADRDITITAGTVTTDGFQSYGIAAINKGDNGNISISTDTVSTSGDYSWGIYAGNSGMATPGTKTDVTVTAGSVATKGFSSYGVYVTNLAEGGSSHISVGSVATTGAYSLGIGSVTRGDTTISAGTVDTASYGATAVFAYTDTGNVKLDLGTVSTGGDNSFGVFASTQTGDVAVNAGTVKTTGTGSTAISARSRSGDVSVTADTVSATGPYSSGIVAQGYGNIAVNAGSVLTSGNLAIGIIANSIGLQDTTVTIGNIETKGELSSGVLATGGTTDVTVTEGISTGGASAAGAQIYGKEGASLHNAGAISTSGDYSAVGVLISSPNGNVTVDGGGSISTSGRYSDALFAATYDGDITIAQKAVTSSGYQSNAINAYVENYYGVARSGNIKIDVDTVSTGGDQSMAVLARNYDQGSLAIDVGTVSTEGSHSDAIAAIAGKGANIGDITINAGTVSTAGEYSNGITTVATGSTTIAADNVTTNGSHSSGIHAYGYGPISINAGTVTTSGERSDGIYANNDLGAQSGGIQITAGTVTTSGDASSGIRALGYQGDTKITAASVSTVGVGSDGIYAASYQGNVNINVATVATTGDSGRGIVAYSGGTSTVIADSVTTSGQGFDSFSDAGGIKAVGAAVNIQVGSVSTTGDYSAGIFANSNMTHDDGQASRDITINAGMVTTSGYGSDGIDAIDIGQGGHIAIAAGSVYTQGAKAFGVYERSVHGDTDINAGTIVTGGYASPGIIAISDHGNVTVTADNVVTYGDNSPGIYATTVIRGPEGIYSIGDKAAVTVGAATTHGYLSDGVYALGGSSEVTVNGAIATYGAGSDGIASVALTGDASVHNKGAILTNGYGSTGIFAQAYDNVVIDGGGTIETNGDFSSGVTVASVGGGSVTIDTGSVSTAGRLSNGIYALARNNYGDASGNVTISAEDVTTRGYQSRGIVALDFNQGGNVTVTDSGTVSTRDDGGYGIVALAPYGATSVDATNVSTRGRDADAIYAVGGAGVAVTSNGSLSTLGDNAAGIFAANYTSATEATSNVSISAQAITTAGYAASGILALNYSDGGNIAIAVDNIATTGKGAAGIYAVDPSGAVTVTAGTVSTSGAFLRGTYTTPFSRPSAITAIGGSVSISAQTISTAGNYAYGVKAISLSGPVSVNVGKVATTGDYAEGVRVGSYGSAVVSVGSVESSGRYDRGITIGATGDISLSVTGPVSMTGAGSNGILVSSAYGDVSVTTNGTIDVTGRTSSALLAASTGGSVLIDAQDRVSIDGSDVVGIAASAAPQRGGDGPHHREALGSAGLDNLPTVTIKAADVAASGLYATAINANNFFGGLIDIDAKKVVSSYRGIVADGNGAIDVQVGSVTSGLLAVESLSETDNMITVTGAVHSNTTAAILADSQAGNVTVNVGSGASIIGGGKTRFDIEPGYYGHGLTMYAAHGTATLNNAGTVATNGNGFAVDVIDFADEDGSIHGHAVINNSGTILGAVKLSDGDDSFVNSGTFLATKDSDFGAGSDSFVNSGVVAVRPGTSPGTVAFLGLESFHNDGGLIDLRNGLAGDVLSLPGSYVGSGNARLGVDLDGGKADQMFVAGAASGHTAILLNISAKDATLLATPVTLVKAGAGSAADAFSIANADIGFIHYGVALNAVGGSFGLTAGAGAAAYRALDIPRAEQAIWHRAADAWETHMAEKRDVRFAGSDGFGTRLWGQAYGGIDRQDGYRTLDGGRIGIGYRQDYYGAQIGLDLAGKATDRGGMLFGITGSYLSSKLNGRGDGDRTQFDTVGIGAYASFLSGPLFANLLGQYDHDWIHADNTGLGYVDKLKGDSYGADLQIGARLGKDSLYIEPSAAIAYLNSDVADLHALGQTVDFDRRDGLTGKIGMRIGSGLAMKGGGKATVYLQAHYVHEFKGKNGLDLQSGGTSAYVSGVRPGDYGQGAVGVNILSAGRLSGFVEGDADVGGGTKGGGGRIGVTFKF